MPIAVHGIGASRSIWCCSTSRATVSEVISLLTLASTSGVDVVTCLPPSVVPPARR